MMLDVGNAGIGGASISNVGNVVIGAGSGGAKDDEEDIETLMVRMTRRAATTCPPDGGESTSLARCAI